MYLSCPAQMGITAHVPLLRRCLPCLQVVHFAFPTKTPPRRCPYCSSVQNLHPPPKQKKSSSSDIQAKREIC